MSLIIARKEGQKIFLIGDTRLTDSPVLPDLSRPDNVQKVADPRDGAIKITLFNSQLCVAFAGASATANEVIKKCRNLSVDQIKLLLRQENNLSENKIQFIVAIGHPEYELIEIKEGKVNHSINTSWIGSEKGFKQYQDTFFKLEKSNFSFSPFQIQGSTFIRPNCTQT